MRKKVKNKILMPLQKKKQKSFDDALEVYENYLIVERLYSDYTTMNYIKDIKDFNDFVVSEGFGDALNLESTKISRYYISYLSDNSSLSLLISLALPLSKIYGHSITIFS